MSMGVLPSVNRIGCKARDKCVFPHHQVDEQPNKEPPKKELPFPQKEESEDKSAVAIVKTVAQLGCVSQDPESLESERGAESRGNRMQKVLGPIRQV